jgi:hypothetical protein
LSWEKRRLIVVGEWVEDTLTTEDHTRTHDLVEHKARKSVKSTRKNTRKDTLNANEKEFPLNDGDVSLSSKDALELSRAFRLGNNESRLRDLLTWPAVQEAFDVFAAHYLDKQPGEAEIPEYRLVHNRLRMHLNMRQPVSQRRSNVREQEPSQAPRRRWDVVDWYVELVVELVKRLYEGESWNPLLWLRDKRVVKTVEEQVWIFYHTLLFRHYQEMEARHLDAGRMRRAMMWVSRRLSCLR